MQDEGLTVIIIELDTKEWIGCLQMLVDSTYQCYTLVHWPTELSAGSVHQIEVIGPKQHFVFEQSVNNNFLSTFKVHLSPL